MALFSRELPTVDAVRSILMIKAHSAGIGDILRSSAAWRALKTRYPQAKLHLLMLTVNPGYSSEKFIARHHLLDRFQALDKRTDGLAGWRRLLRLAAEFSGACEPDLIIDFEPHGLRTSILTRWLRRRCRAATIGIAQVPLRRLFYDSTSVSMGEFAEQRRLCRRMDYTNRDFVALSALGIERGNTAIELRETPEAAAFRNSFRQRFGIPQDAQLLGLNIGCGTEDALERRPSLPLLSGLAAHLQKKHGLHLVIGLGAPFERETDQEFLQLHRQNGELPVTDLAGQASLLELVGFLRASRMFISSDSGPYHMAVAMRTATLAVFNFDWPEAIHDHPWVRCVRATRAEDLPALIEEAEELLAATPAQPAEFPR